MTSSMNGATGKRGSNGSRTGDVVPKGYQKGQLQQFTPEQQQLFSQMFSHAGPDSYLSRLAGGDEDTFNQIEAPAMRDFQALQGQIGSRFSGMGTGGRKSSGFQNTVNQASSDFASDLASRRHSLQRQAIQDLMGLSNDLLGQRPQDRFLVEKQQKQNPWAEIGGRFAAAVPGAIAGFAAGGPPGAAVGGAAGFAGGGGAGQTLSRGY